MTDDRTQPTVPDTGQVTIADTVNAREREQLQVRGVADETMGRLGLLYDLPLQFAAERDLRALYALILERVIHLIPGAQRGALLVFEPASGKLALRASVPQQDPPISRTLIQRAVKEGQGFIWSQDDHSTSMISKSVLQLRIRTGMYTPLLWQGRAMGVLCVDNPERSSAFRREDLQFMVAVAHYAAAAVANHLLQADLEQNNQTLQHLLANFSPQLRGKLLEKARAGELRPGGEKSTVTVLMSDLRGFTRTSARLEAEAVVEMLNDYFCVLGDIIFQHDGTIDKFIGDAILAIFGSPEPDAEHAAKALRAGAAMQTAMRHVNDRRRAAGLPVCELGLGIHTGEVLHGFIGAKERLEYTVIGDTVNKTSRYCDAAGPGEILLSARALEAAGGHPLARRPRSRPSTRARGRLLPSNRHDQKGNHEQGLLSRARAGPGPGACQSSPSSTFQ